MRELPNTLTPVVSIHKLNKRLEKRAGRAACYFERLLLLCPTAGWFTTPFRRETLDIIINPSARKVLELSTGTSAAGARIDVKVPTHITARAMLQLCECVAETVAAASVGALHVSAMVQSTEVLVV